MNDQVERMQRTLGEIQKRTSSRYQIVESIDLRTNVKTYKLYRRGQVGKTPPVESSLSSYEAAEIRARQLEAEGKL
jgi:hypothetical protein